MSWTVWKYELAITGLAQSFEMPSGAEVVHVGLQHGRPTMWVQVEPDAVAERRTFKVLGTGEKVIGNPMEASHLGTVLFLHDQLVWHIFEV